MKKATLLCVLSLLIVLFSSCSQSSDVIVGSDYPVALTLESVAQEADNVVIGSFTKYKENMNMARDLEDVNKEDSERYVEGKIFEFAVNEYVKGIGNDHIDVILLYKNDGIMDDMFYEPVFNEKVVLFLKENKTFKHYYPAIYPYEFKLDKNSELALKTNKEDIAKNFKNKQSDLQYLKKIFVDMEKAAE